MVQTLSAQFTSALFVFEATTVLAVYLRVEKLFPSELTDEVRTCN